MVIYLIVAAAYSILIIMNSQAAHQNATLTHASHIQWKCVACDNRVYKKHTKHHTCGSMLTWTCTKSGQHGLYTNLYRHEQHCAFCSPLLPEHRQQHIHEQKVTLQSIDESSSELRITAYPYPVFVSMYLTHFSCVACSVNCF